MTATTDGAGYLTGILGADLDAIAMARLARHVEDLLDEAIATESRRVLFEIVTRSRRVRFAGSGSYGTTHFVTAEDGRESVFKTVALFPPKTEPQYWADPRDNPAMSEALIGAYYYTGKWKNGYDGAPIPRLEDRVGDHFYSKRDDPLPCLVDYTGFVILEGSDVRKYYGALATAASRTGADLDSINALVDESTASNEVLRGGKVQRLYVMTMEAGEPSTLEELARTDPEFGKYAAKIIAQILSTLYLLSVEDGFVHGDASASNILRKTLPGTGKASMRFRVHSDASKDVILTTESDGNFPLFMLIDFGFARFRERKIVSIDKMRFEAEIQGRADRARLLSWVPEWKEPAQSALADLYLSHAGDKHLFGISLLTAIGRRLLKREDVDPAPIWEIARFITEWLLIPPARIGPGIHPVPIYPDAKLVTRDAYAAFHRLASDAARDEDGDKIGGVTSLEIRKFSIGGRSMATLATDPKMVLAHALRFFPPAAVIEVDARDDPGGFWTHPIFDSIRTEEARSRGVKRRAGGEEDEPTIDLTSPPKETPVPPEMIAARPRTERRTKTRTSLGRHPAAAEIGVALL